MTALLSLLVIISLSILLTRIATIALVHTGIVVLGINRRGGAFLGTPDGDVRIEPADTLILYGRATSLADLDERKRDAAGQRDHQDAVAVQQEVEQRERESAKDAATPRA